MRSKEENQRIKEKYRPIFCEEGAKHIPPIQNSWVNKFINRYLTSESTNSIEKEWKKYLENKKGKNDWEFFICANAKIVNEKVIINSRYHPSLTTEVKNRHPKEIIKDYCKQHELKFKEIDKNNYQLGFYRTIPKFKN